MANQEYKLINDSTIQINENVYVVEDWNMNLEKFLKHNAGKQIYIYQPSILTENIRAIVI
jgi:cell shape-determining protein MreC